MPSFFVPTPGDLTAHESPSPGIYHPRQKKMLMPGGQPGGGGGGGGWVQLELTGALRLKQLQREYLKARCEIRGK